MKPLKVSRPIDQMVYKEFRDYPFWNKTLSFLNNVSIQTILDIGASSGVATLMFLELPQVKRIHCFEPDEVNFGLLYENVKAYEQVLVYNFGIYYGATESGVVGIGDNSPLGYMLELETKEHDFPTGTVRYEGKKFKLTTIEYVIPAPVDLIKLDVEGSEYNIIENSTLLKQTRYLIISFHNHPEDYVKKFIAGNLQRYNTVLFASKDTYSDVLLERRLNENTLS